MTPSSEGWTFKVIYSLDGWGISGSWRNPLLVSDKIYATTHCDGANNAGTVYELSLPKGVWEYTQLYTFTGSSDGLYSISTLVNHVGYLWGIASYAGANGYGVVSKITS